MDVKEQLKKAFEKHYGDDPGFSIEFDPSPPDRVTGMLTLEAFEGKREYERQNMIWDVVDEELSEEERFQISIIIANTPSESAAFHAHRNGEDTLSK